MSCTNVVKVRRSSIAAIAVALVLAGQAVAAPQATSAARDRLLAAYPGAQLHVSEGAIRMAYGRPMTEAPSPDEAAAWFLADHAGVFGVAQADLELNFRSEIAQGRFTVFAYNQRMDGLPVENGIARVLVANGNTNRVVSAGMKVAQRPADGFRPDAVSALAAVASVQAMADYAGLDNWLPAELVVVRNPLDEEGEYVRAWKFQAHNNDLAAYAAKTFFVDASNGKLVDVRNDVYSVDVSGTVQGNATTGTGADTGGNWAAMNLPNCNVNISGGNSSTADDNGDFTIANGGSGSVNVVAQLIGPWSTVNNQAGANLTGIVTGVTPPGPADITVNPTPSEQLTAQVNAFLHVNNTHNFYKDRAPSFNALDISISTNVNINLNCNAYYSSGGGHSLNFYTSGGGCSNTAFSSVAAHEYGHFIVNRLGLSQAAFGEGFGDCMSLLQYDDRILGRGFCGIGCFVRDPVGANVQYPCPFDPTFEVHYCGQILGATWWEMRENFGATHGDPLGLEMIRQLLVDWSQITTGANGSFQPCHPGTLIEVLTVDDDDADLSNGTPNFADICSAFENHSIPCPKVAFSYPNGRPETVTPNQAATVRVDVTSGGIDPTPGTGTVSYRIGTSGPFTTVPMSELTSNQYEASLPGADCPESIQYYFTVINAGGATNNDPEDAPNTTYQTFAATGLNTLADLDFQSSPGWSVSGSASDGQWTLGTPVGGGDRGDPATDYDGSGNCWLTDNVDGNSDVDGGATTLTSQVFDLSSSIDPILSYARWYHNTFGGAPAADIFEVEISDNGSTWVDLETVGPAGPEVSGGWIVKSFRVADFVSLTGNVQVRFTASDLGTGSVVEAGVDALSIVDLDECPTVGGTDGDFDNDGDVDLSDFSTFSLCFGGANLPPAASCPPGIDADFDNDGDVDLGDFAIFSLNFTGPL